MPKPRTFKVGRTTRGARLWFEGAYLAAAGFTPGTRFTATFAPGRVTLAVSPDGDRVVSNKRGVPVVDVIGSAVSDAFPTAERVSVTFNPGRIVVTPAA